MKRIERRQSERTGDAIWMKFECGAGSRWTSTTEDSTGDICGFSGCNCGTPVKFMGDTENRSEGWFGLRVGNKTTAKIIRDGRTGQIVSQTQHGAIGVMVELAFEGQAWTECYWDTELEILPVAEGKIAA